MITRLGGLRTSLESSRTSTAWARSWPRDRGSAARPSDPRADRILDGICRCQADRSALPHNREVVRRGRDEILSRGYEGSARRPGCCIRRLALFSAVYSYPGRRAGLLGIGRRRAWRDRLSRTTCGRAGGPVLRDRTPKQAFGTSFGRASVALASAPPQRHGIPLREIGSSAATASVTLLFSHAASVVVTSASQPLRLCAELITAGCRAARGKRPALSMYGGFDALSVPGRTCADGSSARLSRWRSGAPDPRAGRTRGRARGLFPLQTRTPEVPPTPAALRWDSHRVSVALCLGSQDSAGHDWFYAARWLHDKSRGCSDAFVAGLYWPRGPRSWKAGHAENCR